MHHNAPLRIILPFSRWKMKNMWSHRPYQRINRLYRHVVPCVSIPSLVSYVCKHNWTMANNCLMYAIPSILSQLISSSRIFQVGFWLKSQRNSSQGAQGSIDLQEGVVCCAAAKKDHIFGGSHQICHGIHSQILHHLQDLKVIGWKQPDWRIGESEIVRRSILIDWGKIAQIIPNGIPGRTYWTNFVWAYGGNFIRYIWEMRYFQSCSHLLDIWF